MAELKAWTITQLKTAMDRDLKNCTTDLEKSMCKVICSKEIMTKAIELKRQRKLTPCEIAIVESL